MHASSFENMHLCYQRYISGTSLESQDRVVVVDIGGANVNGSYAEVFSGEQFEYLGVDLNPGLGIDIIIDDPTKLPLDDFCADIVISGQMLEHCEFFWITFTEMIRVLKPDGYLFLIAPSAGPEHRYPVDCYRFYPDAYRALAKFANCRMVDVWSDERGPWKDLVGVFQRHKLPDRVLKSTVANSLNPFDPNTDKGNEVEERISGEEPYLKVLSRLHHEFNPQFYFEIGVRHGCSLGLAQCPALGIDPVPEITQPLGSNTRILEMTSDNFFCGPAKYEIIEPPDLVFIDGMHLFEFVLRDFMHVERYSAHTSMVIIDDIFPNHPAQADRTRRTRVWTGDVWKIVFCLRQYRPDLQLLSLDASPTGLLLVIGLDPHNKFLWDHYNPIVRSYKEMTELPGIVKDRIGAISTSHPVISEAIQTLRELRPTKLPSTQATPKSYVANEIQLLIERHGLVCHHCPS